MAQALQVTDTAGTNHTIPFSQIFRIVPATPADTASRGIRQYIYLTNGQTINAVTAPRSDQIGPVENFGSLDVIGTITGLGYVQYT